MSEKDDHEHEYEANRKDALDDVEAQGPSGTTTLSSKPRSIDGYISSPTLYHECRHGLLAAFLMFCVPDIRTMAREQKLQGDTEQIQRIVECPFTMADLFQVFEDNKEILLEQVIKDEERAQMYRDSLSAATAKELWGDETRAQFLQSSRCVVFSDHRQEQEIVYAVSINALLKRVSVVFRGSVTPKDFRQDAKAILATIANPVQLDYPGKAHHLGIHLGFREYLYAEANIFKVSHRPRAYAQLVERVQKTLGPKDKRVESSSNRETSVTELSDAEQVARLRTLLSSNHTSQDRKKIGFPMKYQLILEQVADLLEDNPDFRLHISGHSLGGALATLFSMEAAADDRIPAPVTCVTSGAPKVGNIEFLRAYEALEKAGRVRCVHVKNDQDPVTKSPPNGSVNCFHALFCQSRRFRHVGLSIQLQRTGLVISCPPSAHGYVGLFCCDCWLICRFWLYLLCVAPCVLCFFGSAFLLAVPVTLFCIFRQMKTLRKHHTQLKYLTRLDYCREDLDQLYLDELNEMRWERPAWRLPILHTWHGNKRNQCHCCCLSRKPDGHSS